MSQLKTLIAATLAAGVLSTTAMAVEQEEQFSALQGIQAQAMSVEDMAAIEGQIDIDGLRAVIVAKFDGRLETYLLNYVNYLYTKYPDQIDKILAYLTAKYGI